MRDDLDDYLISIGKVAIAAAFLEEVVIHWGCLAFRQSPGDAPQTLASRTGQEPRFPS
jgi:hypothetical protein